MPHPDRHPGGGRETPPLRLIAWEVTRACNLACRHCRAEACPTPSPDELDTDQAKRLIDSFPEAGDPIVIFTGGEPLLRPDIFELAAYAAAKGLRCVMAPNGTLIDADAARRIRASGIMRCSISIDAPDAASHDAFRGQDGAFQGAMRGIAHLREAGVEFQINTTVTRDNQQRFKDILPLAERLGAAAWHIFLLVPTGRGAGLGHEILSAEEYEQTLNWLYDRRKTASLHLKATCAPHYHRIMRQRAAEEGTPVTPQTFGMDAMTRGCLGGIGFCFISHTGVVQPCGYLELPCGDVTQAPFPAIWRDSPQFLALRDPSRYLGKCGPCEFHRVCGGCRARALAMRGDHLAEEPLCAYLPKRK